MNLARFISKPVAHIFGIRLNILSHLAHNLHQLLGAGINRTSQHRLRSFRFPVGLNWNARRHELLGHLIGTANGTGNQAPLALLFKRRTIPEPAIKFMALVTDEIIFNHANLGSYSLSWLQVKVTGILKCGYSSTIPVYQSFINLKQQNAGLGD